MTAQKPEPGSVRSYLPSCVKLTCLVTFLTAVVGVGGIVALYTIGPLFMGEKFPLPYDRGITCLAEQGSTLFASSNDRKYLSEDGGLNWQETSPASWPAEAKCNPNYYYPWTLWFTSDGQVQYRFTQGKSIERSVDQGKTWQREVDLSREDWKPRLKAGTSVPTSIDSGPFDALGHLPTGNVVVAAGNLGVLVRLPDGQWRWVSVGDYYRGEPLLAQPTSAIAETTPQTSLVATPATLPTPRPPRVEILAHNLGNRSAAFTVAFSPDGQLIATGGREPVVRLWSAADGAPIKALEGLENDTQVSGVVFSPDGRMVAASGGTTANPTIQLWSVSDGKRLGVLSDSGRVVAFSFDNTLLASTTPNLWRVSDGKNLRQLTGLGKGADSVAFSHDGKLLAAGDWSGTVRLWRVEDGTLLRSMKVEGPGRTTFTSGIAFSNDDQSLLAVETSCSLWRWRVADGSVLSNLLLPAPHPCEASFAAFSPDASLLATSPTVGAIWLWRVADRTLLGILQIKTQVRQMAFSPDGVTLGSVGMDGFLRLWSVAP